MKVYLRASAYNGLKGVDYTHLSLGGGFSPGFKVNGGYDFVGNAYDASSILTYDAGPCSHIFVDANTPQPDRESLVRIPE